ncbi:MAG: ComF family protein [Cyanobacteria bacterium Co-bin13]|nr:ComF family protein [Cyanobacteria bacterium Co-bin13]
MPKPAAALTVPLTQLLNVFLTSPCPLCDRTSPNGICPSCRKRLEQERLLAPLQGLQSSLPVLAWGGYQGSLRQALGLLKYQHKPALAQLLGSYLGQCWQQQPKLSQAQTGQPVVVPIPLHVDKLSQRGFNQAELLAYWFCRQTQLPLASQGLVRVRTTQAQHGLGAQARQRNLDGAFGLGPAFHHHRPSGPVLLIDDIYTTGATVLSAAQTLRHYGISVVGVGTIARAMPSAALEQS